MFNKFFLALNFVSKARPRPVRAATESHLWPRRVQLEIFLSASNRPENIGQYFLFSMLCKRFSNIGGFSDSNPKSILLLKVRKKENISYSRFTLNGLNSQLLERFPGPNPFSNYLRFI